MRVLLTGASGSVGKQLRPLLARTYKEVLLTSRSAIGDLEANERHQAGDISDAEFVNTLVSQVDGVIHLAGAVGPDFTFAEVMGPNVIGTYNVFQSAYRFGVRQIIYASSHHAVGFLARGAHIDSHTPARADSYYGVSKAFGEVLASYFADKFGLNIMAIRIGYVGESAIDERRMRTWCSPRDLAQLIHIGLSTADLGYRLVYGVSDNPGAFFDNSEAVKLGFVPRDSSLDNLANPELRNSLPDPSSPDDLFVGGYFASRGLMEDALLRLLSMANEVRK